MNKAISKDNYWKTRFTDAERDASEARRLLADFATLADDGTDASPHLVQWIAGCVLDWKKSDFSLSTAKESFRLKLPKHRPLSEAAKEKSVQALVIAFCERLKGVKLPDAFISASTVGLSESSVRRIYEKHDIGLFVGAMLHLTKEQQLRYLKLVEPAKKRPPQTK